MLHAVSRVTTAILVFCLFPTVLRAEPLPSDILRDTITIDMGVDANIVVGNPFVPSAQAALGNVAQLQDFGGDGATNGDPNYTRTPFFYGEVTARQGECSNLASASFNNIEAANVSARKIYDLVPIPVLNPSDGPYTVTVQVSDSVDNDLTAQRVFYLDRAQPVLTPLVTSTVTILNDQDQPISSTNTARVHLLFENMAITDQGYGDTNPDKPFWGVWVANSIEQLAITDTEQLALLDWQAMEIDASTVTRSNGLYNFRLSDWSVFAGLTDIVNAGGRTQYMYVKAIDGAGNVSFATVGGPPITLSNDIKPFSIYLPRSVR
ncbi:MAG: hypothetical protein HC828_02155 [Blastochloris sp.]|nr:hypothetical protein [Blastochloris sp.]